MSRHLLPLSLAVSLIGCYDETNTTTDPTGSPEDGSWTDDGSDPGGQGDDNSTGGDDDNTGGSDDGTDNERRTLAQVDDPCDGSSETALEFDATGDLFAGCGEDEGLHVLDDIDLDDLLDCGDCEDEEDEMGDPDDGGGEGSFELLSELSNVSVYNLSYDSSGEDGSLLISGSSTSSYVLSFLYEDEDGEGGGGSGEGHVTVETEISFSFSSDFDYSGDSCSGDFGSLSVSGDGGSLLWSSGGLSGSSDDWEAENTLFGGSVSNLMLSLTSEGEGWDSECFGAGQSEDGHPSIYSEGSFDLSLVSMSALEFEEHDGYFSDIESSLEGMFAGGLDAGSDEGLLYSCDADCDEESSWDQIDLSLEGMGEGSIAGEITDIDFDNDGGSYGMIVGHLSGSAEGSGDDGGGYAMFTTDGGLTWETVAEDLPQLDGCAIDDEGNFAITGAGDFMAVGEVSDYSE